MYISHWLQVQLQSLQWRWCKGSQRCSRGTLGIIRPKICHPHVILYLSKETQISSCRKAWLFPVESKPWLVTVVLFGINVFYPCHSDLVQPCSATSSTATATWTTCRVCASSTSYTRRWSRRWRRCSSTTCRGSRCSSWRRLWMCCASVAPRSCSPTSLPSTSKRTTSPSFSRWGGNQVVFLFFCFF